MKIVLTRIISLTLLILTFIQIFGFSNQNGEESGTLSRKAAKIIVEILPNTKNKNEEEKIEIVEKIQPVIRKLAHFSIYALVGILAMTFINTYNLKTKYKFSISILIGLIYAITDEIHQSLIPGRNPSVIDVGIDTLGTIFGIILVFVVIIIYYKITDKCKEEGI